MGPHPPLLVINSSTYISNLVEKVSLIFSNALGTELSALTSQFKELPDEAKKNFLEEFMTSIKNK